MNDPSPLVTVERRGAVRVGRALASPLGVLITVPLLVVAVGLVIMLVGRDATQSATHSMARRQLAEQAKSVQADVAFALDQADPLMKLVRVLADRQRSAEDVLVRLHDLMAGRPGVAFLSISFPDGTFRGAQLTPDKKLEVQESTVLPAVVRWFTVDRGVLVHARTEPHNYDPRTRGFYKLAVDHKKRTWTEPYTFFKSHETGITCTEPVYNTAGELQAVLTVDFHVGALSSFVARPALDQARTLVYTGDGTILAYPAADKIGVPTDDKLLRAADLKDPALDALFAAQKARKTDALSFLELTASDGEYLASVAPIGGTRAGIAVPLDWYVGTVVPSRTLLGPTRTLLRSSIIASAGALGIAVCLALVLAWNLLRMRRQVVALRTEAQRQKELGSYRLVAKLGTGGMGEVWKAEHRLLARNAAIKLIRPDVMHDEAVGEVRERFRREAQTLASMKSRHTIEIFDYGVTQDGTFYYVMELLDGLDLEQLVVRYGAQPAARVIEILAQACSSLAEAHDAGLYHRDIKPPNLYLCRAADEVDIVKLLDFGIVQTVSDMPDAARIVMLQEPPKRESKPILDTPKLTQIGAMLGTPGFMPPEQILGMPIDGRADLYALGCVGWWLLAGGEVFSRKGGEAKVLHRHMYEQPPVLQAMTRTWLPDELEDVIRAMLAKDANQRPVDARELSRALRAIPIPEEYAWTTERAQSWWRAYTPPAPQEPLPSAEIQMIVPRDSVPHIKQSDEPKVATISNPVARTKLDMSIQPPPPPPRRRR